MAWLDPRRDAPTTAESLAEAGLAQRLRVLEAGFRQVAATRMRGVPVLNPALQVQAVGFRLHPAAARPGGWAEPDTVSPAWASGVLVTPWFMNLLRLPLRPLTAVAAVETGWLAPGACASRALGTHPLDFIGALEGEGQPGELGAFEVCSLFSPMFQFADQAAAVATACEVLKLLREPAAEAAPVPAPAPAPVAGSSPAVPDAAPRGAGPGAEPVPARRGFLLGRSTGRGAA